MTQPAISFDHVTKRYGENLAVDDVTFEVTTGSVVAIIGPSGSGKSTLCRCVNQLEQIDAGEIRVHGETIPSGGRQLAAFRAGVGMVFQSFNLFPNRTILDNVTIAPIMIRGESRTAAEENARMLLERVGIGKHANKHPAALSGGEQQRAAIARALAMGPRVMLFDEPTSALDPESIKEVLDVMEELASTGMTMLAITHEMGFASQVADDVVFMDQGRLVERAPARQFFESPGSERASRFISQLLSHQFRKPPP